MRQDSEIRDRVRGILVEELDRRVAEAARRTPTNCIHNLRQPLDVRKTIDGEPNPHYNTMSPSQSIGLCMLGAENPEEWKGDVCEDSVDAQRCPNFAPRLDKNAVLSEFESQLRNPEWVLTNFPTVAALIWVLNSGPEDLSLPWWKRLLYYFLKINVEPLQTRANPLAFLPRSEGGHDP
jgi:hypothetical protein